MYVCRPSAVSFTSNALDTVIHARRSDVDGDGLQALDEVQAYGTDPNLLDSDGGGDADGVDEIVLRGARHPTVERVLEGGFVPNDVSLR